jgi:hypothetical protein
MATFRLESWLNESPSTATVTLDGAVIFDGEVGPGQPIDTTIDLAEFSSTGGNIAVTVNSGYIKVGQVQCLQTYPVWGETKTYTTGSIVQTGAAPDLYEAIANPPVGTPLSDTEYWKPHGPGNAQYWGLDVRSDIKINGQNPSWPDTPPYPGDDPENPDWGGWFFDTAPGSTVTFTITVPN